MVAGAYVPKRLVGPFNLVDGYTNIYTANGPSTIIKQIVLSNITGIDVTVRLNLTNSSTQPDSSNALLQDVEIEANSTVIADMTQVMNNGDKLWARTSVSGSVNITISGVEESAS